MGRLATKILLLLSVMLLMCVAVALPLQQNPASANGATRLIVNDAQEGPYLFRVGILPGSPRVGNLHLSILIQSADGDVPINDGRMIVMATGPEAGMTAGPVQASNTPQNPQVFDADIILTALGSWTLSLETESGLGAATLEVPLQVTEGGGINLLIVVVIVAIVVIIGALGWSQVQRSRRPT
jgi:hypothetical protein